MGKKDRGQKNRNRIIQGLLVSCLILAGLCGKQNSRAGIGQLLLEQAENAMVSLLCPTLLFASQGGGSGIRQAVTGQFPLLYLYGKEQEICLQSESGGTYEDIIRAEGRDETQDSLSGEELETPRESAGKVAISKQEAELVQQENERARDEDGADLPQTDINPAESGAGDSKKDVPDSGLQTLSESEKKEDYQWESFESYDALVKEFYAVDASTAIDEKQLNLESLLGRDLSLQKREDDRPQILIYHTHSQEGFADSVPGDPSTTIMGVGEVLAQILREQYGYTVLHHLGQYDVEDRDYAYNNALPALEQVLADNPDIQVVIDLHRDEMPAGRKLVTQIDGKPTARFMFFNGLSRTRKHGDIGYLPNENIADNLAFSFQMQVLCNEYYPGLARRIYLKGYRYNMHVKPRYLLIEMGAQNNTYEECYNACLPLARILDLELSGADFGYSSQFTGTSDAR